MIDLPLLLRHFLLWLHVVLRLRADGGVSLLVDIFNLSDRINRFYRPLDAQSKSGLCSVMQNKKDIICSKYTQAEYF